MGVSEGWGTRCRDPEADRKIEKRQSLRFETKVFSGLYLFLNLGILPAWVRLGSKGICAPIWTPIYPLGFRLGSQANLKDPVTPIICHQDSPRIFATSATLLKDPVLPIILPSVACQLG